MIKTFKSSALKKFWQRNQKQFVPANYCQKIKRILTGLDRCIDAEEMNLPAYRLHQLSGGLAGFWSIKVSANWRIIFRMEDGNIYDVDLIDYH